MHDHAAAAAAIAARIRAAATPAELADPTSIAATALADMEAIERGENIGGPDAEAWAIEEAGYAADECEERA